MKFLPRLLFLAFFVALSLAASTFADTFAIDFYTLDGGGGVTSGDAFSISPGAIGQPATARPAGVAQTFGTIFIYGGLIAPDPPRNSAGLSWALYE